MNKVLLMGRLGKEPDVRETAAGKLLAQFQLATHGGTGKPADWHRIVAWDAAAERSRFLRKGDAVFIEGRLQTRSYQDQGGAKAHSTEVIAWTIMKLNDPREAEIPEIPA